MYKKLHDYDFTIESIKSIKPKLESLIKNASSKACFLGFDGYIDSLYHVVQERKNSREWTRMGSMKIYGELAISVAGSSANIERVLKKRIFGGFAPNTCRALSKLRVKIFLVAALGYPNLNEYYEEYAKVESLPLTNPGETMGLEFNDGKIMITDFENIYNVDWDLLINRVPRDQLIDIINKSDMMGFGHWALIPSLDNIWNHFLEEIFPVTKDLKKKLFFVDVADIRKRPKVDVLRMLQILRKVNDHVPVMLSMNDQEAIGLSKVLEKVKVINPNKKNFADFIDGGKQINDEARLSFLVIHSPHFATISTKKEHFWITQGYTSKPSFTVAGGDHFHSGTALGLICKLSPPEAILIGNALAAIFVRTGASPNFEQLFQFMNKYLEYIERDNSFY